MIVIHGFGAIGLEIFHSFLFFFTVFVYFSSSQEASERGIIKIVTYSEILCARPLPILYYILC